MRRDNTMTRHRATTAAKLRPPRRQILLREDIGGVAVLTLNRPQARNSLSEAHAGGARRCADRDRPRRTRCAPSFSPPTGRPFPPATISRNSNAHRADADRGRAYFKHDHGAVQHDDAADRHAAAAGDRRGAGHGDRGGLPAGRQLRSRGRLATPRSSRRRASISACSARRRWWRCRAMLSRKHAMEMLLTGELIAAEDAARIGLVNRVVAAGSERDEALKLAEKIAGKSALTRQDRQGGVLSPGRNAARRGLQTIPPRSWSRTCWRATPRKASAPSSTKREPKWEDR